MKFPSADKSSDKHYFIDCSDFQTIGVTPAEWRPSVIRRAALGTSLNHVRQMTHATATESDPVSELAKVSLATYRLLDPRRRPDPQTRAHVGRILPLTLVAADPSSFQTDQTGETVGTISDDASDAAGSNATEVERDNVRRSSQKLNPTYRTSIYPPELADAYDGDDEDAYLIDEVAIDLRPPDQRNAHFDAARSLSHDDLIWGSPRLRRLRSGGRRHWRLLMFVAITGVCIGAAAVVMTSRRSRPTNVDLIVAADPSETTTRSRDAAVADSPSNEPTISDGSTPSDGRMLADGRMLSDGESIADPPANGAAPSPEGFNPKGVANSVGQAAPDTDTMPIGDVAIEQPAIVAGPDDFSPDDLGPDDLGPDDFGPVPIRDGNPFGEDVMASNTGDPGNDSSADVASVDANVGGEKTNPEVAIVDSAMSDSASPYLADPFAELLGDASSELGPAAVSTDSVEAASADAMVANGEATMEPINANHNVDADAINAARNINDTRINEMYTRMTTAADAERFIAATDTILNTAATATVPMDRDALDRHRRVAAWFVASQSPTAGDGLLGGSAKRVESVSQTTDDFLLAFDKATLPEVRSGLIGRFDSLAAALTTVGLHEKVISIAEDLRRSSLASMEDRESLSLWIDDSQRFLRMRPGGNDWTLDEMDRWVGNDMLATRYAALVLRRWPASIAPLATSSDARLAAAARSEADGQLPADEVIRRWQIAADATASPHEAESIRRHIEALRKTKTEL